MDSETVYIMDDIRGRCEHLQPDEYITILQELIDELQGELEAMQDGA